MVDFVDEVGDALKRDAQKAFALRLLPLAIGLVVVVGIGVGGYFGYKSWHKSALTNASVQYEGALKALDGGNTEAALGQLKTLSTDGPRVYKALALMQLAAAHSIDNKPKDAVAAYDQAAALFSDPLLADAARLKAAYIMADTADFAAMQTRLKALTGDASPYRYLARELLATKAMEAGEVTQAREAFEALTLALDAPEGVRERAQATLAMLPKAAPKAAPKPVAKADAEVKP